MAVNFPSIDPAALHPVAGVTLGWAEANIRKPNRKDVLVIRVDEGASVAGVFTQNRFCAAPVTVCREHLAAVSKGGKGIRALVVNTGNANAGTGEPGMAHARETCAELARLEGLDAQQILPFSTGVILEPLPIDRLKAGLPAALANQQAAHWFDAAQAIMTTDTLPKAASRQVTIDGHVVTLSGISKGAGMIKPNMATMLGFLAFDANVAQPVLRPAREARRGSLVQLHHDRRRYVDQRFVHPDRVGQVEPARDHVDGFARLRRIARRGDRQSRRNSRSSSCATAKARPSS